MAKTTTLTSIIATTFLILSLFSVLIPSSKAEKSPPAPTAHAPSPGPDCLRVLVNVSDCLTFVAAGSNVTKPDKGCCPEVAGLIDGSPICLCHMLSQAQSGVNVGFNIDVNRAHKLPSVCNLEIPPVSTCADLGVPVGAPLASDEGPAPSPGGIAFSPTSDNKDNAASTIAFSKMNFLVGMVIMLFTTLSDSITVIGILGRY